MLEHAGELRPERNRDLERADRGGTEYFRKTVFDGKSSVPSANGFDDAQYQKRFSSLNKMLEPWIGCTVESTVDTGTVRHYIEFLHDIDHLSLLESHFDIDGNQLECQKPLMITDLGNIMDISLIMSMLMKRGKLYIVEAGGGYGVLPKLFFMYSPDQVRHALIDTVPASLLYAQIYLKERFLEANAGSQHLGDDLDLDKYHCYVTSPRHFEKCQHV